MSTQQMKDWMQQVVTGLRGLGYVEKIFWNCGEDGASEPGAEGMSNELTGRLQLTHYDRMQSKFDEK